MLTWADFTFPRRPVERCSRQVVLILAWTSWPFWQWSASDLVNNTIRGILAEFIVAKAFGVVNASPREPWASYDLCVEQDVKLEVKSAAYIQSWTQQRLSRISFSYAARRGWDADTNEQHDLAMRYADAYVFGLLHHKDKGTINPLNLDQWEFYVAATKAIAARTRSQHSINLNSLSSLCRSGDPLWSGPVPYARLRDTVLGVVKAARA